MTSNLLEMRKRAGYSARGMAEALGVAPSTYSRYEWQPASIPVDRAWQLADILKCSIDAVVGRAGGGRAQEVAAAYAALSPEGRATVDELLGLVAAQDAQRKVRARDVRAEQLRRLASSFEQMMLQEALAAGPQVLPVVFGDEDARRGAYREYVAAALDERRAADLSAYLDSFEADARAGGGAEEGALDPADPAFEEELAGSLAVAEEVEGEDMAARAERALEEIMAAYDQLHPKA